MEWRRRHRPGGKREYRGSVAVDPAPCGRRERRPARADVPRVSTEARAMTDTFSHPTADAADRARLPDGPRVAQSRRRPRVFQVARLPRLAVLRFLMTQFPALTCFLLAMLAAAHAAEPWR